MRSFSQAYYSTKLLGKMDRYVYLNYGHILSVELPTKLFMIFASKEQESIVLVKPKYQICALTMPYYKVPF